MAKLFVPLVHTLITGAGALLGYLLLRARRLLSHLPARLRPLLLDPHARAELLQIIADLAGYANLTNADRRTLALEFITQWLNRHHVPLSDHEVALLVELLYAHLHQNHPEQIVPAPAADDLMT